MAWATDLMRTSLPTVEKNFSFHPWNVCHTRSLMLLKISSLFRAFWEGNPRYCPSDSVWDTLKICLMESFITWLVLGLTMNIDFSKFTIWSEAFSYISRILWIVLQSLLVALKNKRLSSAKNKWDREGQYLLMCKPVSSLFSSTLLRRFERPSVHKRKRYGERGSP